MINNQVTLKINNVTLKSKIQRTAVSDAFWLLMLGILLGMSPGQAMAVLGKTPPASVVPFASPSSGLPSAASGAKRLSATSASQSGLYTTHETQLESGTVVREYATATGPVFAVSWSGPVLPDLDALLGGYFSAFQLETDRARSQGRRGSPVNMMHDGLVVRSNGRMRNFFGHAYVPALIPAGVSINDVFQ
jgi:hypothetical protein